MSEVVPEAVSVRRQLRESTRPAHQQLEATLNLLDEKLSREDYKKILMRFYGFWQGWQPLVGRLLDDAAFTRPRQRLHMLVNDLSALGMDPAAIAGLPACPMPALQTAAAALGSLYVMEGSTLGGGLIEKELRVNLSIVRGFGASYFAGYGKKNGQMWRGFLDRLEAAPVADTAQITSGAGKTFATLASWFAAA